MKLTAATILLTALAVGHSAPSYAGESAERCTGYITSLPAVITTQGQWCLSGDASLNMQHGAAITIAAHNVTLDCDEYKLGNVAAGAGTSAIGIQSVGRSNTVVRDCRVRGFRTGIALDGFAIEVENNRLDANTTHGIVVQGDALVVRDNRVLDTGDPALGTDAIAIHATGRADILDNDVLGVSCANSEAQPSVRCHGIFSDEGLDSLISGNRVRDVAGEKAVDGRIAQDGIQITAPTAVRVVDNHLPTETIRCSSMLGRSRGNSTLGVAVCPSSNDHP